MKRNIAIVAGGDTSEIVVSLRSAQGIYQSDFSHHGCVWFCSCVKYHHNEDV